MGSSKSNVEMHRGKIIISGVVVAALLNRGDITKTNFRGEGSVVLGELLGEYLVVGRANPIHSVIDHVLDARMPCLIGHHIKIVLDAKCRVRVLEGSEDAKFAISNAKNQIASSARIDHSIDGVIDGIVELKNIAKDEDEWDAHAALITKSSVRIGDANFRDSELSGADSSEASYEAHDANVHERVSIGSIRGWVIDSDGRKVAEGSVHVPIKSSRLDQMVRGRAFRNGLAPSSTHRALALGKSSKHVHTNELLVIDMCGIGHASELLVDVIAGILASPVFRGIERNVETHIGDHLFKPGREDAWKGIFNLTLQVSPNVVDEGFDRFAVELTLRETHLVRSAVEMRYVVGLGSISATVRNSHQILEKSKSLGSELGIQLQQQMKELKPAQRFKMIESQAGFHCTG